MKKTAAAGRKIWNAQLRRIDVAGGRRDTLTTFYTAMYHAFLQPNVNSDVAGTYRGPDQQVHRLAGGPEGPVRQLLGLGPVPGAHPAAGAARARIAGDFVQSMLNASRQNGGVWDRWLQVNSPTRVMTGDPSAVAVAGMYALGVRNFEVGAAFDSLVRQATVPNPAGLSDYGCPGQCAGMRPNLEAYERLHYAPQDECHCWGGAAETLEDATADYALAQWAEKLGRDDEARLFTARAGYWQNTFNPEATPEAGYQQPRLADGSWLAPFDLAGGVGFAQGTSATYTWMVQHDVHRLVRPDGRRPGGARRGSTTSSGPTTASWAVTPTPDGYDPTNEPGIHIPWLYNALGRPWKTQETVRTYMDLVYGTGSDRAARQRRPRDHVGLVRLGVRSGCTRRRRAAARCCCRAPPSARRGSSGPADPPRR